MEYFLMADNKSRDSKVVTYAGRTLSALAILFLLMDGAMKLFKPAFVVEATTRRLGYPESAIVGIGVTLLTCTALYILPRTRILGAILLTGYLGGAVASNVRAGTGWFNTLFPVSIAVVVWLGLGLRDEHLKHLLPLSR
jgi:hypothetical protein